MISRRKYEPLGVILASDEGLHHLEPGRPLKRIESRRFTAVDFRDGLGLAAAPDEGVWVHDGRSWQQRWEGNARSVSVAFSGTLYIGVADGTLQRSSDKGATWEPVEGVVNILRVSRAVPPIGVSTPYVVGVVEVRDGLVIGVAGAGCWHTHDRGATWLRRTDGLDPKLHHLIVHPEQRDRLFATADAGIYRSDDEGYSWLQSLGGLDRSWGGSIAVMPGAPDALILSVARHAPGREGAVFRSANGGVNWQRLMLEDQDEWERVPAVVRPWDWNDLVFIAAGTSLFASHDRGRQWLALADDIPVANAITAAL